jgi:glycosyltransferase involved in cell wall biosynthesis
VVKPKSVTFAVPGDLATPTGGYAYDRHIIAELRALGWSIDVLDLGEGFPHPTSEARVAASMRLAGLRDRRLVVVDGLALGVLPEAAAALQNGHSLIALVHHPLALETGLDDVQARALRASERDALACARRVITTSAATARVVTADFSVPSDRLHVVEPGTERVPRRTRPDNDVVSLLSVGSVIPRKGYDVLVAALGKVAQLPWRLAIIGDRDRDLPTRTKLDREIARHQLGHRIRFIGAVEPDRLTEFYAAADVFVLPSRYEGYGMAFAEAIAHGLPVIGSTAGAIPDTVPAGTGLLVPPDDVGALADALQRLIAGKDERARLAAGARAAAAHLPTWQDAAQRFAQVLEGVS